jgi:hypothetical protein
MRDYNFVICLILCSLACFANTLKLKRGCEPKTHDVKVPVSDPNIAVDPVPVPPPQPDIPPVPVGPLTTVDVNTVKPVTFKQGDCFHLKNLANGKYISANRPHLELGFDTAKSDNTRVCIEVLGNDEYILHVRDLSDNRVYDIFGGDLSDGTRLIKYPRHGGANQRFKFVQSGNIYSFIAVNSNKAFGASGDQNVQRPFDGKSDQLYLMELN